MKYIYIHDNQYDHILDINLKKKLLKTVGEIMAMILDLNLHSTYQFGLQYAASPKVLTQLFMRFAVNYKNAIEIVGFWFFFFFNLILFPSPYFTSERGENIFFFLNIE